MSLKGMLDTKKKLEEELKKQVAAPVKVTAPVVPVGQSVKLGTADVPSGGLQIKNKTQAPVMPVGQSVKLGIKNVPDTTVTETTLKELVAKNIARKEQLAQTARLGTSGIPAGGLKFESQLRTAPGTTLQGDIQPAQSAWTKSLATFEKEPMRAIMRGEQLRDDAYAVPAAGLAGVLARQGELPESESKYRYMTQRERQTYNYWLDRDPAAAKDYLTMLERELDKRNAEMIRSEVRERAAANPAAGFADFLSAGMTVPLAGIEAVGQNLKNALTGENVPVNPYSTAMMGAVMERAAQTGLLDRVESKAGKQILSTALSVAQIATRAPMGAFGLPFMAMSAAGGEVQQRAQEGKSAEDVLALGIMVGATEYITEKLPFDALLKTSKTGGGIVKSLSKIAGAEGMEEFVNDYMNTFGNNIILGSESDMKQDVLALMAQGMSRGEAERQVKKEYLVWRPLQSALGGALAGGALGGGAAVVGNVRMSSAGNEIRMAGAGEELIDVGLMAPQGSEAFGLAKQLEQDVLSRAQVKDSSYGRLAAALQNTETKAATERPARTANELATWRAANLAQTLRHWGVSDVVIDDALPAGTATVDTGTGEIRIASDVAPDKALTFKVAHELLHPAAGSDRALTGDIISFMRAAGMPVEELAQKKMQLYAGNTDVLPRPTENGFTPVDAEEEVAADYIGNLLENENLQAMFAKKRPGAVARVIGVIQKMADSLAGRDGAQREAARFSELAGRLRALSGVKSAQGDTRDGEPNGIKQSIGRTTGNKPFVTVEKDILSGVPETDWVMTVKQNLNKKFPGGVTVGNSDIKIDYQSRKEMTFSKYMQWLYRTDSQIWADKLKATDNADEILIAATGWVNEGLNHPRQDSIADFARGKVLLRVGGNDYMADVVVGTRKSGSMMLYDLLNLVPASFTEKETNAVIAENPSPGTNRSTVFVSTDSIRENTKKSNTHENKSSLDMGEDVRAEMANERDSDGRPLTRAQAEYFKDSKVRDEDGNLLVVYHGTDANFTVFDRSKSRANMDIQGNFFSPWEIDAAGYGPNVRMFYLNVTNPAPENVAYKALNKFKGQNNAGVKARDYLIGLGYDGVNNGGEEYIAFSPEQIKSVGNNTPTSDPDIRFSLDAGDDVRRVLNDTTARSELKRRLIAEFGVEYGSKRAVSEAIDAAAETVQEQGEMDEADLDMLLSILMSAGTVPDDGSDPYAGLGGFLKGARIYVPQRVRAEFGDGWKSLRGRALAYGINLTGNSADMGIDMTYLEAADRFGVFPADETDEAAMLRSMLDGIGRGRQVSVPMKEYLKTLGPSYEESARETMRERLYELLRGYESSAGTEAEVRSELGEKLAALRQHQSDVEASMEGRLQKSRERVRELRRQRQIDKNADRKSPMEIPEVRAMLSENAEQLQGAAAPSGLADVAELLTGRGISYNKDFARNLDAAAGGDKNVREVLKNAIERPFLAAKKGYANEVSTRLTDFKRQMDALGIKKGSGESSAVMWYGEGQRMDEYGDMHEYTLEDLKGEFPGSWENVVKATQVFRGMYDEYIDRINRSLEEVYPNALQQAEDEAAKARANAAYYRAQADEQTKARALAAAKAAGIEGEMKAARGAGRVGTKKYSALAEQMVRADRAVTETEEKIARFSQLAEEMAAKAVAIERRIESGDVLRNKRLPYRKDYFRHFQEMSQGFAALQDILTTPADIDSQLAGISEWTRPKSRWAGFMQQRGEGGRYVADAVAGMAEYIPQAEYKIAMDPVIASQRAIVKTLAEGTVETKNANKFIEWMTEWTNELAGKTNYLDRAIQKNIGRKFMRTVKWLNNRAKGNAVMGNVRSAVAQFFNLPNAAAYIHSPGAWARGAKLYTAALAGDETARGLYAESGFLTERYLDDALRQFDEGVLKSPKRFVTWLMTFGDRQAARLMWAAAYADGTEKTADPIEYADDIARRATAGRGIGEVPVNQRSQLVGLLAPFQVEVNNTWQLLKERHREKDAVGLLLFYVMSYLMNEVTRKLGGFDVSFDPINALKESLEDWTGRRDQGDESATMGELLLGTAGRLTGETISNMPYGSYLASLAVSDENERAKLFGDSDPTRFGVGSVGIDALSKTVGSAVTAAKEGDLSKLDLMTPLSNFVLPWGGRQLERAVTAGQVLDVLPRYTREGFTKTGDAASFTDSGRLRFAVDENDAADVLRMLTFGEFSTKGGQEYLDKKLVPLSEKQTEAAVAAAKLGVDLMDYVPLVRELSKVEPDYEEKDGEQVAVPGSAREKKLAVLDASGLDERTKAVVYRNALTSESAAEVFDSLIEAGESWENVCTAVRGVTDAQADYETVQGKRMTITGTKKTKQLEALRESGMSEAGQAAGYLELVASPEEAERFADLAEEIGLSEAEYYRYVRATAGLAPDYTVDGGEKKAVAGSLLRKEKAAIDALSMPADKKRALLLDVAGDAVADKYRANVMSAGGVGIGPDVLLAAVVEHVGQNQADWWGYVDALPVSRAAKDYLHNLYYSPTTLAKTPWRAGYKLPAPAGKVGGLQMKGKAGGLQVKAKLGGLQVKSKG